MYISYYKEYETKNKYTNIDIYKCIENYKCELYQNIT